MSHINYNFLTESFLFGIGMENMFSDYSDDDIRRELCAYREHVLANIDSIRSEILVDKRKIKVTVESFGNRPDEETLKQLALYMDCVLIEDPLFDMTETKSKSSEAMAQYLGMQADNAIDRNSLVEALRYMKDNTRLIVCDFIKFIPISLLHEAPKDIPIVYDENGFSKSMPNHIKKFLIDKLDVRNIVRANNHLTVKLEEELKKGTGLYLYFPECRDRSGEIVFYQQMEKVNVGEESNNRFTIRFYIPDSISQFEFDVWLEQSKNRAALQFLDETIKEYLLAADLGGMYLTRSILRSDLLSMMWNCDSAVADVASLSMGIKLPVLRDVGIAELVEIRQNYGESFNNFRAYLGEELIKFRGIDNTEELKKKLDNLSYTINETRINEINQDLKKIKTSLGIDAAVTVGSLLTSYAGSINGSVAGNAIAFGALATGAFSIVKDAKGSIKDYVNIKRKPGYFLWRIENKSWNMR